MFYDQGVPTLDDGARNKFGAPVFESKVFRKQMHCIEGSNWDIVETFQRSPVIGARGIVPPSSPLVTPLSTKFISKEEYLGVHDPFHSKYFLLGFLGLFACQPLNQADAIKLQNLRFKSNHELNHFRLSD